MRSWRMYIPKHQIYGINEHLLVDDIDNMDVQKRVQIVAADYQSRVFGQQHTTISNNNDDDNAFLIDCALLGFGPDGHTCSLFPGHELLKNNQLLVAGIYDSPKPPSHRITLTLKTLNQYTNDVIFVGVGESKNHVLNSIFHDITLLDNESEQQHSQQQSQSCCTNINNTMLGILAGRGGKGNDDDANNNNNIRSYHVEMKDCNIYPFGMVQPRSNSLYYIVDQEAAGDIIHLHNVNKNSNNRVRVRVRFNCAML